MKDTKKKCQIHVQLEKIEASQKIPTIITGRCIPHQDADHQKRNQAFEFENDEGQRTTRPDTKAKIQVRETEEGGKSANEAQQLL